MQLTRDEEIMLSGGQGEGVQKAMEILVSIGDMNEALGLIDIKSVQISGVSYKTIGDAGLEFLQDFSSLNVRVKAFATLNPAGIDLDGDNTGVPENFLEKQSEILRAYKMIGAQTSCTCTPYLAGNLPSLGEHIAWAESSAVAYANSVIGARTNRESSITALASAITGKTPLYGLHQRENRVPDFAVEVSAEMKDTTDLSILGYYVGKHFDGIPMFKGIKPDIEGLKALSAGLATGRISMFHVEGVTPEKIENTVVLERIDFTEKDGKEVYEELNSCENPDILCIGCPHATVKEIKDVVRANPRKEVWIYTARQNRELLKDEVTSL
jgi:predicted aconitase